MVSGAAGGVCRLDDTGRVDVPTLRSTTTGDDAGTASSVGPGSRSKARGHATSITTIGALLHSATKNPERAKEFRSSQTPGARYLSGWSLGSASMTEWPVLASMSVEDRNQLLRTGRHRRFAKGETIFHHGDPADSLHLLATGRVAVRVLTPQGDQAILTVLGPGKVFGELALIDPHAHRTATITAIQPCETIMIGRKQFELLRTRYPQIDRFLLASLAATVNRLSEHLLETLFVPAALRVTRRLLILDEEFGGEMIPLTQEDLALMAGTTRATVNEVLNEFQRTGAVKIGRGRIEVLNRTTLVKRLR
jgi:CRP/FNR family transcriptional regulator, cyclic AMP receptor protein